MSDFKMEPRLEWHFLAAKTFFYFILDTFPKILYFAITSEMKLKYFSR